MLQYNLSDFEDVNDFLLQMAVKMGTLKKGGVPDIDKAAQRVLSDWTNGKLTYFTEPPERSNEIISTELVTQMKEAFDIDALLNNEDEQLNDLPTNSLTGMSLSASMPTEAEFEMNEEESMSESESSIVETMDEDHGNDQSRTKNSNKVLE
jgi:nuclear GTP-binding protein